MKSHLHGLLSLAKVVFHNWESIFMIVIGQLSKGGRGKLTSFKRRFKAHFTLLIKQNLSFNAWLLRQELHKPALTCNTS